MRFWDDFKLNRAGAKYLALADALSEAIERGDLSPGRRLPSHRALARRLDLAVGTVSRAYEEVLERGLITSEVGCGSFVSHHRTPPLSLGSERVPAAKLDLLQNLPVATPEIERRAWSRALASLRSEADLAALSRRSFSEVSQRNQQIGAAWLRRVGLESAPREIFDCPGVQSALCAIIGATTEPGDLVLAASLSHPGFKAIAQQYGLKIHGLEMDDQGIVPAAFEAACRAQAPRLLYISPTIHPPTTATMTLERRQAVASIADRHDLLIVEDESASFLRADPPLPISAFAPRRCFFVGDTWMALSLGLRTTYVRVPEPLLGPMAASIAATSGVTPPLIAEVAALWIESEIADRLIEERRSELNARNAMAREILGGRGVRSDPCGHHVWLELADPWRSDVFVARAETAGIAIAGAKWFAVGHASIPEAVRVSIGNAPGRPELRWALTTLDALIDEPMSSGPRPTH